MKIQVRQWVGGVVAAGLLGLGSAAAQNAWERMGAGSGARLTPAQLERLRAEAVRSQTLKHLEARRAGNPTRAWVGVELEPFYRVVEGRAVSLRPLLYWRNAGTAYWEAFQPFAWTNPCPGWEVVEGRLARWEKAGVLLFRERGGRVEAVLLRNWPGAAGAVSDQPVRVVARAEGPMRLGAGAVMAYDHGTLPEPEELGALKQADDAAELAREQQRATAAGQLQAAAAEAEAKRRAEVSARVEKARAERVAKKPRP